MENTFTARWHGDSDRIAHPEVLEGSTMARIVRLTAFVVLLLGLLALPGGRSAGARDAARLGRLRERARVCRDG